ncbi:hypothetical protein CQA49_06645 [Helicobacter sp. MIT 00-7814]|nr:hypothetical protein CQA49_06645 [Helicobacter sp. MIT 00-7814]RDU54142.1 hypothetical protein CQA37_05885 [Helicobacter sp. MIT 99-10781]
MYDKEPIGTFKQWALSTIVVCFLIIPSFLILGIFVFIAHFLEFAKNLKYKYLHKRQNHNNKARE